MHQLTVRFFLLLKDNWLLLYLIVLLFLMLIYDRVKVLCWLWTIARDILLVLLLRQIWRQWRSLRLLKFHNFRLRNLFFLWMVLFRGLDNHYWCFWLMSYNFYSSVIILNSDWFFDRPLVYVQLALTLLQSLFFFLYGSICNLLRGRLFLKPGIFLFNKST